MSERELSRFERAKEPRPVDDPRALVPYGWAPGDYFCGECLSCKEPFTGSDKRSWRCQDCAERLRDASLAKADTILSPRGEQTEAVAWLTPGGDVTRSYACAVEQSVNDPDNYPRALVFAGAEAPSVVGAFVAGPVWLEPEITDEDGGEIWTSEVQTIGGYSVIATVHGGSEAQAIARRDAILAALSPQALGEDHGSSSPKSEDTHRVAETPVVGWQPIETAPRDGTHFLAYEDTGDIFRGAYHREGYLMCFGGQPCVQTPEPTHWMPLPPAPSPTAGDE